MISLLAPPRNPRHLRVFVPAASAAAHAIDRFHDSRDQLGRMGDVVVSPHDGPGLARADDIRLRRSIPNDER